MPETPLILVVDDEADVETMLRLYFEPQLQGGRFTLLFARDGYAALRLLEQYPAISLIFVDINMPGLDGLKLVDAIRRGAAAGEDGTAERYVVMLTAYSDMASIRKAMRAGANDYLSKPIRFDEMERVVESHLKDDRRCAAIEQFLGHSKVIERLRTQVRQVADHPVTVVLEGETGTGKSLLARLIHQSGCRASGPFVNVHCGALPENLAESELFGHVKGAFSGAAGDRSGKFRQAHGGTLFLDEIGTLGLEMQVKLLKAIEEQQFFPLGSDRPVQVDVRILAASNEPLAELVQAGRFRQDLLYRLQHVTLTVPPLRERRGDIPLLAACLLDRHNRQYRQRKALSRGAVQALEHAEWPGNVRSLANVLEKACLLCPDDLIDEGRLDLEEAHALIRLSAGQDALRGSEERRGAGAPPSAEESLRFWLRGQWEQDTHIFEEFERELLAFALDACDGNKQDVAAKLRISRGKLYRALEKHGL